MEVLVAMTLLTTALVPAYVLTSNAVSLSQRIRNELIASGLAQEGVEIVRAIRDANWFKEPPEFATELDDCEDGCRFQYDSTEPEPVDPTTLLAIDPDTGLYQYDGGDPSLFTRTVTIRQPAPAELVVTSEVRWNERGIDKSVSVQYHLFDWIK